MTTYTSRLQRINHTSPSSPDLDKFSRGKLFRGIDRRFCFSGNCVRQGNWPSSVRQHGESPTCLMSERLSGALQAPAIKKAGACGEVTLWNYDEVESRNQIWRNWKCVSTVQLRRLVLMENRSVGAPASTRLSFSPRIRHIYFSLFYFFLFVFHNVHVGIDWDRSPEFIFRNHFRDSEFGDISKSS